MVERRWSVVGSWRGSVSRPEDGNAGAVIGWRMGMG